MLNIRNICLASFFLACGLFRAYAHLNNDVVSQLKKNSSTKLSRVRRYLVFPESSSFLVIFDLTYPALAIEGNAFMFGHTAALSWGLPSTPIFLNKTLTGKETMAEKTTTTTELPLEHNINYPTDWNTPLGWNHPDSGSQYDSQWQSNYDFNGYPNNDRSLNTMSGLSNFWEQKSYSNLRDINIPPRIIRTMAQHIQRRSRRELYNRIGKLLSALSKDGKQCVLKAICQVHQLPEEKGTMLEEILKAIFRAKHFEYPDEDSYDKAANKNHDCEQRYPNCDGHVLSNLFKNKLPKNIFK